MEIKEFFLHLVYILIVWFIAVVAWEFWGEAKFTTLMQKIDGTQARIKARLAALIEEYKE